MSISRAFASVNLDRLLLSSGSSACPVRLALKPNDAGRRLAWTKSCSIKCEGVVDKNAVLISKSASLLALEKLKTSAANRYTKEKSSIVAIGLNIHTAPVQLREKLAIVEDEWPQAIAELSALYHVEEAAVLSTCNRIEIYVVALSQHRGVKEVTEWMSKRSGVPISEICQHRFLLYNKDATQHIFEVSAGLDSVVLGEGQILGQVKKVAEIGQGVTGFGRNISGLFRRAISVGKRVRSEIKISEGAVSVASAAVELAFMKLPESSHSKARVLVVGAGKMGKGVIKHLVAKGCTKIVVVNRSEEKVTSICEQLKDIEITYKPLSEMLNCAAEADVVFASTSSENLLFSKKNIMNLPRASQDIGGRRLFFDIAVPRNVDSCIEELDYTEVYNVDDLEEVVAANNEDRRRKAIEAHPIIAQEREKFEAERDSFETVPTIKNLRVYAEEIIAGELDKCLSKMGDDVPKKTKRAIDDFGRGIVNRLLKGPMEHLKYDGSDSRCLNDMLENMKALNRMYSLDTEVSIKDKIREKLEKNQK